MNLQGDYLELEEIAADCWFVAEESGWHRTLAWNPGSVSYMARQRITIGERLDLFGRDRLLANMALIHSEVSEAVEAVRKDPEHIGEELADVLIRTLELAEMLGIHIGRITEAKMRKNRVRADVPARAGGKRYDQRRRRCMTSERSVPSSSPSPSGGGRSGTIDVAIPMDFVPYVATQDHLRCDDCSGYTVHAATIGIVGRFCSCPFDREHS